MQTDLTRCYACGSATASEIHHAIFFAHNRKNSDRTGLIVKLCPLCHKGAQGVHGRDGNELRRRIEREAQIAFEQTYPNGFKGKSFKQIFGKDVK